MTELELYIKTYFSVDERSTKKISQFFKPVHLSRAEHYTRAGRYCDRMGFLQSGIVREYIVLNDKEITKWISTKGYFVVDLASFMFREPGRFNIHALTDAEILAISADDYQRIGSIVEGWAELEKLFLAKCFAALEDRMVSQLALSAEERYRQLLTLNPELFNEVPLQYLASMLGITPETLSRLRKKLSQVG